MLKSLYIKNYALIDELTVEFDRGLSILTGETGAGKSIIIDALSMILGERADSGVVRNGSEKAVVEATFSITDLERLQQFLQENSYDEADELIIRREISVKSQSRCFINDTPSTIGVLKQVGDMLVDLHGQHEHQSLLRTETHIDMLDDFSNLNKVRSEFAKAYTRTNSIVREKETLQHKKQQIEEKRALYEYQLQEIGSVNPEKNEDEHLEHELHILEHSEQLATECHSLYEVLYDGEHSVIDRLGEATKHIESLHCIDDAFKQAKDEIDSACSIVDELANFVREYRSRIEFRPERLEEIRVRLGQLSMLKKKYGGTFETLLHHKELAEKELSLAENVDSELERLEKEYQQSVAVCATVAQTLSKQRQDGAKKLNKKIIETLSQLGIAKARFETSITQEYSDRTNTITLPIGSKRYSCSASGIDNVEFYISTNVGENPKPLVNVASGGEISRIMLALKMNLVNTTHVPLLIFDEIDVGISGRISQSVGQAMKELAKHHQVIAITHLPQIAGFADAHFVVEKKEEAKRAITSVRKLTKQERITEVARLMSGEAVTDAGLQSARELIEFSGT